MLGAAPAIGAGRGSAANSRFNVGIIGHGLRGSYLAKLFTEAAAKTGACA